jgi:transcription elongation factor Elf1/ribosomal protein L40E
MTTKTIQCPHCSAQRVVNLTDEQLEKLKKNELVIGCMNCGLYLRVNTGENPPSSDSPVSFTSYSQEEKTTDNPQTRRLRFLVSEREQKCAELEQIVKQTKSARTSGILHALTGDAQTTILQMQQMNARAQNIQSEIRKIDFEIQQLQSEIANKGRQNTQTAVEEKIFCRYCGVQNETDAVFCKKCGKKIA